MIKQYCTDTTIAALTAKYGDAFERLGIQRWLLLSMLASDANDAADFAWESAAEVAHELEYLDDRARAGVIAAIAHKLWEAS